MSFKICNIKSEYRTLSQDVVTSFYLPILKEAKLYQRAVGYFSSSSLIKISEGICSFAKNGGKIQLVASPNLSAEDIASIKLGYQSRQEVIEKSLFASLNSFNINEFEGKRLNLLASLIACNQLDFKIAYLGDDENSTGIYHEKLGIFVDDCDNTICFSGSMNETGYGLDTNYEAIDVFCDWKSDYELNKCLAKKNSFSLIWQNQEPHLHVEEFISVKNAFVERYHKSKPDFGLDLLQFPPKEQPKPDNFNPFIPPEIKLYDYQREAISNWANNGYCGIFDMATGTGKTLTGLGAIVNLSEHLEHKLAVIIVVPYQHLVDQWVEDIKKFNINPIMGYSASPQKNWEQRLKLAIHNQKYSSKKFFTFICTNDTFKAPRIQNLINNISNEILLVIDEAHNFGAESCRSCLNEKFKYRLALSATLERHYDEEGTNFLKNYFGKKCIHYDLKRAIKEDKLTAYYYHPVVVNLSCEELLEYKELSQSMKQNFIQDLNGNVKLNTLGKYLAIKRAQIVAGATEKITRLKEIFLQANIDNQPYTEQNNMLIYCGTTTVKDEDDCGIKQIEQITRMLGLELNMRIRKFTSQENMEERNSIKKNFIAKKLQAIVAIKCLDEGVNIPSICTAFILASTTNPKEYIQRRGRVLRKYPGKLYAQIYDFVTLPRDLNTVASLTSIEKEYDLGLIQNEMRRVKEFGSLAINRSEADTLLQEVSQYYNLEDLNNSKEFENE